MGIIIGMIIFAMLATLFVVFLSRGVPILGMILFGAFFLLGVFTVPSDEMSYSRGAFMLSVFMIGFVLSVFVLKDRHDLETKELSHELDKRAALDKQKREAEAEMEVLKKRYEEELRFERM